MKNNKNTILIRNLKNKKFKNIKNKILKDKN